jgi:DNA-binding transcriptional ArsR family regulator
MVCLASGSASLSGQWRTDDVDAIFRAAVRQGCNDFRRRLDLNLVRVLDALLRERSVTCAGERIGLSQPAVSAALNRLRHALNDQLFVRRGNEMLPTPRAESLAEPVRVALREIERVFQSTKGFAPAEWSGPSHSWVQISSRCC